MNETELHLVLGHFPIVGTFFGVLAIIVESFMKRPLKQSIGLYILITAAILAIPTYLSGEGAEHFIEKLNLAGDDVLEKHESVASTYIIVNLLMGMAAIATLVLSFMKKQVGKAIGFLTLFLGVLAVVLAFLTSTTGIEIRHTEIRETSKTDDVRIK